MVGHGRHLDAYLAGPVLARGGKRPALSPVERRAERPSVLRAGALRKLQARLRRIPHDFHRLPQRRGIRRRAHGLLRRPHPAPHGDRNRHKPRLRRLDGPQLDGSLLTGRHAPGGDILRRLHRARPIRAPQQGALHRGRACPRGGGRHRMARCQHVRKGQQGLQRQRQREGPCPPRRLLRHGPRRHVQRQAGYGQDAARGGRVRRADRRPRGVRHGADVRRHAQQRRHGRHAPLRVAARGQHV